MHKAHAKVKGREFVYGNRPPNITKDVKVGKEPALMIVKRFGVDHPILYIGEFRSSDGVREGRGIEFGRHCFIEGWFKDN